MPVLSVLAAVFGAAVVLVSTRAQAQPHVEGELNRAKAALQLKKFDEAARRFGKLADAGHPVAQFSPGTRRPGNAASPIERETESHVRQQ